MRVWKVAQTVLSVLAMLMGLIHVLVSQELHEQLVGIAVMIFAQFALNFAQFLWKLEHWRDMLYEEQDIEV